MGNESSSSGNISEGTFEEKLHIGKFKEDDFRVNFTSVHGFRGIVTCADYDATLGLIALGSSKGFVKLISVEEKTQKWFKCVDDRPISFVHFLPGQKRVLSISDDNVLRVWNLVSQGSFIMDTILLTPRSGSTSAPSSPSSLPYAQQCSSPIDPMSSFISCIYTISLPLSGSQDLSHRRITATYLSPFSGYRFLFLGTLSGIVLVFDTLKLFVSSFMLYSSEIVELTRTRSESEASQHTKNAFDIVCMSLDPFNDGFGSGMIRNYSLKTRKHVLEYSFHKPLCCFSFDSSPSGLFCVGYIDGSIGIFNKEIREATTFVFVSTASSCIAPVKSIVWDKQGLMVLGGTAENEKVGINLLSDDNFSTRKLLFETDSIHFFPAYRSDKKEIDTNSMTYFSFSENGNCVLLDSAEDIRQLSCEHYFNPNSFYFSSIVACSRDVEKCILEDWLYELNSSKSENPSMLLSCHLPSSFVLWNASDPFRLEFLKQVSFPKNNIEVTCINICIFSRTIIFGCRTGDVYLYSYLDNEFSLIFTMTIHVDPIVYAFYVSHEQKVVICDSSSVLSISDSITSECISYINFEHNIVTSVKVAELESNDCLNKLYFFSFILVNNPLQPVIIIGFLNSKLCCYSLKLGELLSSFEKINSLQILSLFVMDMVGMELRILNENRLSKRLFSSLNDTYISPVVEPNESSLKETTESDMPLPVILTDEFLNDSPDIGYIGPRFLVLCDLNSIYIFYTSPITGKNLIDLKLCKSVKLSADAISSFYVSDKQAGKDNQYNTALVVILSNYSVVIYSLFDLKLLFTFKLPSQTLLKTVSVAEIGILTYHFSEGLLFRVDILGQIAEMKPLVDQNVDAMALAPRRKTVMESLFGNAELNLVDSFSKPMSEQLDPGRVWSKASISPEAEDELKRSAEKFKRSSLAVSTLQSMDEVRKRIVDIKASRQGKGSVAETTNVLENNLLQAQSNLQLANELGDKSNDLADTAKNFAEMAKQLRKQNESSWF